jgi:molybdopterin/thiamine biosynthesis adenylyltransferase
MERKSISEIISMSEEECNLYVDSIINSLTNDYTWEHNSIPELVYNIRKFPIDVITNHLVVEYIEACKMERQDSFQISVLLTSPVFSDAYNVLKLEYDGNKFYTIAASTDVQNIIDDSRFLRDYGVLPDYFKPRVEIETEIQGLDNKESIIEYLKFLGLLTEEEAAFIIPVPSATLDVDETTARFSSAIWFEKIKEQTVVLAGLGGIGSYVAFLLSRMHPRNLFLYDDDTVEAVNLAGQMFGNHNIGERKAYAIGRMVRDMSNYMATYCINEKYIESSQVSEVMICGFDNMEARKVFFNNWVKYVESKPKEEQKNCFFIDGRLAAEEFQVFGIRGDDTFNIVKYAKEYLFSDAEADETLCSYKQTSYMANMIGSVMVNLFTNFVANSIEDNIRELPFLTTYDGSTMTFKTKL